MQQPALTLMIVDDHPLMRRGVRQLLALDPRLEVIAEASNGTEALAEARHQEPDIILLDLNMKGMSGLDTLKALRHEGISSRILVLTVSDARSDIFAMVDAGADGYLLKDEATEALVQAITTVVQGGTWFSRVVMQKFVDTRSQPDPLDFTPRELELLAGIAQGWDNRRLAAEFELAEQTVRNYISRIYEKLGVRSRAEAVVWARKHGYDGGA